MANQDERVLDAQSTELTSAPLEGPTARDDAQANKESGAAPSTGGKSQSTVRGTKRKAPHTSPVVRSVINTAVLVAVFALVALFSLNLLQTKLLENARQMGDALAHSYAIEEENNALVYQQFALLEAEYFEGYVNAGWTDEELTAWLQQLGTNMTAATPATALYPYAVVNGRFISSDPDDKLSGDAYKDAPWYTLAVKNPEKVVFTDAYTDHITGKTVITIAIAINDTPDILAFDIHPDAFGTKGANPISLPADSSYYLCDGSGTLLYCDSVLSEGQAREDYIKQVLAGISAGEFEAIDSSVVDPNGNVRAVYYHIADNGWISIVTVPFSTLLGDLRAFTIGFGIVFALLLALTIWQGVRNYRSNKLVERTNDTVRVLGNSYYAIYRVNHRQGTYEMTKGSDYVRSRLPATGSYQALIDCALAVIEPKTRDMFASNFSLENVRSLVARGVRDFGGDFLRLFGDRYLWVSVRLLMDESLSSEEAVLCFRIVDDEKRANLQRLQLMEDSLDVARRSQKARNRFFSSMSHDLRTPLNAIINLSQLADMHADDAQATRGYLEKIRTSGSQMLALVNDILDVSRLEEGDALRMESAVFDLGQCAKSCVGTFEAQARRERKSLTWSVDVKDSLVRADANRLTQVMNNLLSNALKYSDEGASVTLEVRQATCGERHNSYQFIVSDTGIGMSPEFVERIFIPYERETTFSSRNVTGTGLGMPIVKSIVDRMDGTITVESELGRGSTFTVTVPLESANYTDAEQGEKNGTEELREPAEPDSAHGIDAQTPAFTGNVRLSMFADDAHAVDMAGTSSSDTRDSASDQGEGAPSDDVLQDAHVLMAEDNEINREIAVEMLSMRGVRVTCAADGQDAVEAFAASEPGAFDAILMDMQMPRMDGCDAARAIRAMGRSDAATIPIIATTANAFAEDIAATTEAGMNAHVSKPIDFQALFNVLEDQITRYRGTAIN